MLDLTKSLHPVVYGAPPPSGAKDLCGVRQFANGRIDHAGLPSAPTDDESSAETKKAGKHTASDYDSENDGDGEDNTDEGDNQGDDDDANPTVRAPRPARAARPPVLA